METAVAIVLVFVAVVLGLAVCGLVAIVRWLAGGPSRTLRATCPHCGRSTPGDRPRCDWCGRGLFGPVSGEAAERADLAAMERQLWRMKAAGVFTADEIDTLLSRITQYRAKSARATASAQEPEVVDVEVVEEPRAANPPAAPGPVRPAVPSRPPAPARPSAPVEPRQVVPPISPPKPPRPVEQPRSVAPIAASQPAPVAKLPAAAQEAKPQAAAPKAIAPLVKPQATPAAKPPAEPRRPWSEVLGAFMEDRNIRIGELVGGLLFIVFSVLLTASLWQQIVNIKYYQFFIFVAVSSAVFGAGLYAHHRLRLETTGASLLAIATLLVPLNFFTMVGVSKADWTWISIVAELTSLGIFTWLVYQAARVLVPEGPWHQVAAVLGNSAAVLVLGRVIGADPSAAPFLGAAGVPAACLAGSVGAYLWCLRSKRLDAGGAGSLFMLLGTAAFATAVAWGLLLVLAAGVGGGEAAVSLAALTAALDRLALWIVPAAATVLAVGLTVMRRTTRDKSLAAYRTAGTVLALVGAVLMLVALGLAWPMPPEMAVVSLLSSAVLLWAAFRYRMPVLHFGVIAFATTGYLTGYHYLRNLGELSQMSREELARDMIERLLRALVGTGSSLSGAMLVGLCAVLGLAAELLARGGWRRHGLAYARGAVAMAVLSLSLVTAPGLLRGEDSVRAMFVYAIYGAGCLALNIRWRNVAASYLGLGLLVGATCWAMRTAGSPEVFWGAVLAEESLAMALLATALGTVPFFAGRPCAERDVYAKVYRVPLLHVAEAVAVLAVAVTFWTAWRDRVEILAVNTPLVAVAALCAAATWLLLAWAHRTPERTWTASMAVLAGLLHTLTCNYTQLMLLPWPVALLAHSTLAVGGAVALDLFAARRREEKGTGSELGVRGVLSEPLLQTALLSSALAVPAILFTWTPDAGLPWLAACLFWLAGVWLVIGMGRRSAAMISMHQVACALAVVAAALGWLERQLWAAPLAVNPLHPWTLQACGAVLAVFCLVWLGVRIALGRAGLAGKLLDPPWPAVDRVLLNALVAAQLVAAGLPLLEGVSLELVSPGTMSLAAFGPGAWLLWGVLAAALGVSLWHRWGTAELVSTLLALAVAPCLVAGRLANDLATASALRWGLGLVFLAASAAVWQRRRLRAGAVLARTNCELPPYAARLARTVLVALGAAPVLLLTLDAAWLQLAGLAPPPPKTAVFFHQTHSAVSYLVPLVLVMAGMVGYAVRDRSAGYAFSAGLVADMAVVLGYALALVMAGARFGWTETAVALQLGTIAASLWAGAWLAARRWIDVWREDGPPEKGDKSNLPVSGPEGGSHKLDLSPFSGGRRQTAKALMNVQLAIPLAGNVALVVPALLAIGWLWPWLAVDWTAVAGRPLGWIALLAFVAAYAYRRLQSGRRVPPEAAGLVGMAVLGLLACAIQGFLPGTPWAYRTLMLGWASYALLVAAAAWWVATIRTLPGAEGPPQALLRAAALWVGLAGGLAVLLGLKAATVQRPAEDLLWAAAAIAVAGGAGATMAYWRRAEGWAFTAALGVNLAASLAVWYFQRGLAFLDWWVLLVQANVIATAAVALVWLAARRRLYQLRELSVRTSPLLGTQTTLAVAGLAVLLALPVARLVAMPLWLSSWAGRMAEPAGWIALVLVAAAAAGYLHQTVPRQLWHVAGGLAMALPVMLACLTARGTPWEWADWGSYHVLTTASAAAVLVLLGAAMLARKIAVALSPPSTPQVHGWITWLGTAAVVLAVLWSHRDPAGLAFRVRAVLAVALAAGLVAMWLRQAAYVYVSGVLACVAGTLVWNIHGPGTLVGLAETNILCLAAVAVFWTVLKPLHRGGVPAAVFDGRPIPFSHAASVTALAAMLVVAAATVALDLAGEPAAPMDRLGWAALIGVAAALVVCLWDGTARFPLAGLYLLGLAALGLSWHARQFTPREIVWVATTELPGFAIAAAAAGWALIRARPAWRVLRIPDGPGRFSGEWFAPLQAVAALVGAVLCVWVALDFGFDSPMKDIALFGFTGRLAAMPAALMLLGTAVVMAGKGDESHLCEAPGGPLRGKWDLSPFSARAWHYAGFAAGVLLQCSIGWSLLGPPPEVQAPWLHRAVTLMVASAMMTLMASVGLARFVPPATRWIASGRRIAPAFGGLALAALAAVLAQEGFLYHQSGGVPMAIWEVVVVAAALVGLAGACIAFAVVPGLDRFGFSERGRTVYVYAAEVLLLLMGIHVGLTLPWLFKLGILRRYWTLIVMAVAFAGAGLSELFHRRRLPVLSEPLEWTAFVLPFGLAGASLAGWVLPEGLAGLVLPAPAPAVWFLISVFYAVAAWQRRPAGTALPSAMAVLALNAGLWLVWDRLGIGFVESPQLWLIPVGLCVLVGEYLNHERLTATQSGTIRYLALSLIYVSSTADMYMAGIGASVVLPLVLMFLSVAGVLLGILLRVRSFLVLGITFLLVLSATMVKYVAVDLSQVWVLWACGVATALAIIALFAVFEKRRNDILRAAEKFRHWER